MSLVTVIGVSDDEARVTLLRNYAKAHRLPNLSVWCMVWLDPANDGARSAAERRLREWLERGDPSIDAPL